MGLGERDRLRNNFLPSLFASNLLWERHCRLQNGLWEREKVTQLSGQLDPYTNKPALPPPPSQPATCSRILFPYHSK